MVRRLGHMSKPPRGRYFPDLSEEEQREWLEAVRRELPDSDRRLARALAQARGEPIPTDPIPPPEVWPRGRGSEAG